LETTRGWRILAEVNAGQRVRHGRHFWPPPPPERFRWLLDELLSESSSGSLGRASSEPLSEVSGGVPGKLPGAGLGPGFAGLPVGALARLPGEFCRRLLPESFGPEFRGGFPEVLDERSSEELESRCRKVARPAESARAEGCGC
jgi:hypothetical protein